MSTVSEATCAASARPAQLNASGLDFTEAWRLLGLYAFLVTYELAVWLMLERFLSKAFAYARIVYVPERVDVYFWVCILTPLAALPAGTRINTASQFMFPVMASLILLTTPVFLVGQLSPREFWPLYGCIMTSTFILAMASRIKLKPLVPAVSQQNYRRLIAALIAFFVVFLLAGARQNFQFVSFEDIYMVRASEEYSSDFTLRVVIMYVFSLGGLLAGISILKRKHLLLAISLFGFAFCYAVSQFKSAILAPAWLIYIYLAVRFFCKNITWRFYCALTAPFFIGVLGILLYPDLADNFSQNYLVFAYLSFIIFRFYGTSNIAVGLYQEYFANGHHPLTYWSHVTGVNWFVHYPYGSSQIAHMINLYFGIGEFNAGFLSTDSIAAYGYEAIPLVTLGMAAIYVLLNSVSYRVNAAVLAAMMIMPALMFNERAMSTSFLTGGVVFLIFFMGWMPLDWREGISDKSTGEWRLTRHTLGEVMKESIGRYLDYADAVLCKLGLLKTADWEKASARQPVRLYAGKLRRALPQFATHTGLTPFFPSSRNIPHDICLSMPIADNSVSVYQSEDVFEHVPYDRLPAVFDEIYRVLKPGGLFRLSVPDYGNDIYRDRSLKDDDGNILFDPGGGGAYENGTVVNGGHLWFPTFENVQALFGKSRFAPGGQVNIRHATLGPEKFILDPIEYSLGYVQRTPDHDDRAMTPRRPLSIVVDAYKAS